MINMYELIVGYVKPELVILAVALYLIGLWLKNLAIKDKYIPLILGCISIAMSVIYVLATGDFDGYRSVLIAIFTSFIQGILVAGLSTYINQMVKQLRKDE